MTYCILKTSAQQTSSKSLHCYRGVSLPSPCIVCAEGLSTKCRDGWMDALADNCKCTNKEGMHIPQHCYILH